MTSGLEMEWNYSGRTKKRWKSKKIDEASKKRRKK